MVLACSCDSVAPSVQSSRSQTNSNWHQCSQGSVFPIDLTTILLHQSVLPHCSSLLDCSSFSNPRIITETNHFETNQDKMPESYQTFYRRPYSPPYLLAAIALTNFAFIAFHDGSLSVLAHSPSIGKALYSTARVLCGGVITLCLLGIAFDPATTITRKRRVGGYMDYEGAGYTDGAGGENTYGSGG